MVAEHLPIERRPDQGGSNGLSFPDEWGVPPVRAAERRSWIVENVIAGEERRARGERVEWLEERERA